MKGLRQGFSLVELLVAVSLTSLLAALAVPSLLEARKQADKAHVQACAREIALAQEVHFLDQGRYGALEELDPGMLRPCRTVSVTGGPEGAGYRFTVARREAQVTVGPEGIAQAP